MNQLWTFGDSWAEGYNLTSTELSFTEFLHLEYKLSNYQKCGETGSSLGLILHTITTNLLEFKKDDFVVVIIPPDTRWYVKRYNEDMFRTLHRGMKDYEKYLRLMKLDNEWFKYHHNLFIYTIQKLLLDAEVKFVLAHNYGQIELLPEFEDKIDKNLFLDINRSLTRFLGGKDPFETYNEGLRDDPAMEFGKYFIENDNHPNEAGHKLIAELLKDKMNELY